MPWCARSEMAPRTAWYLKYWAAQRSVLLQSLANGQASCCVSPASVLLAYVPHPVAVAHRQQRRLVYASVYKQHECVPIALPGVLVSSYSPLRPPICTLSSIWSLSGVSMHIAPIRAGVSVRHALWPQHVDSCCESCGCCSTCAAKQAFTLTSQRTIVTTQLPPLAAHVFIFLGGMCFRISNNNACVSHTCTIARC
jgi:hypothetical protein